MKRRTLITTIAATGAAVAVPAAARASQPAEAADGAGHITEVTAITEVFGEGQKLTAVAVRYDGAIDSSRLTTSSFTVADRTVTKVYANTAPAKAKRGKDGPYVIVELSRDDAAAALYVQSGRSFTIKDAKVSLTQSDAVVTARGRTYAADSTTYTNSKVDNLIVDDFEQYAYTDAGTGKTIQYNLYKPKHYDERRSYPLVLFMHDAGVVSDNVLVTLLQGNGATVWASPGEQAKHEAFVLAPQFANTTDAANDGNATALKTIKGLVESVAGAYSIDTDRLYTTGQSGGGMASIALDYTYPDLFAASYLVACQWGDLEAVKPLASDRIWAVVSQGDERAYPGMTGIMDTLAGEGAQISRAVWSGESTAAEFAALVRQMRAQRTPINFVALEKGTVVPDGQTESSGANHINTWRIAYSIEGIRDWLFRQTKQGTGK